MYVPGGSNTRKNPLA